MNSVNRLCNSIKIGAQTGLQYAAFTATHAEPLEKIAKITVRFIDGTLLVTEAVSKPFSAMSNQLKDSITVFESVKFFGAVRMLVVPNKRGKYIFNDPKLSWQKPADRVCLTFHNAFKTYKGLNKAGFVQLGAMSKEVIGKLPLFTLLMDSFIVLSSFFGTWHTFARELPDAHKVLAKDNDKLVKWEYRPLAIAYLRMNDETERLAFLSKYTEKGRKLSNVIEDLSQKIQLRQEKIAEINAAGPELTDEQKSEIKACEANIKKFNRDKTALLEKQAKNNKRLDQINAHDCRGLADDLAKQPINGKGGKIHKWEVIKHNDQIQEKKSWLRVANNIGKIAIVTIALTFTALFGTTWTLPFVLGVMCLGNVVDGIGYVKFLYDGFAKEAPVPGFEKLAASAA